MQNARILQLQGVENFRDLGGYAAANGAVTKWGKVFRSGHLAQMSAFDCAQLEPLRVKAVFDLRTPAERKDFPTCWHGQSKPDFHTIDLHPEDHNPTADLFDQILQGRISRHEVEAHMLEEYARFPFEFQPILALLCERLLEPRRGALIIHCTAGKDRTGCIVALLLSLLGVPRERVLEDYLLSNEGFAAEQKLRAIADKYRRKVEGIGECIHALRPLVKVEARFLIAALDAIEREMGSLNNYFEFLLGVDREKADQIRRKLLRDRVNS